MCSRVGNKDLQFGCPTYACTRAWVREIGEFKRINRDQINQEQMNVDTRDGSGTKERKGESNYRDHILNVRYLFAQKFGGSIGGLKAVGGRFLGVGSPWSAACKESDALRGLKGSSFSRDMSIRLKLSS